MTNGIQINGLTKSYGATAAPDGLDLSVVQGEVHGFLGPNGAGKTTTLLGLMWVVVGFSLFVGLFGTIMGLPSWAQNMSPMEHIGHLPMNGISWTTLSILVGIATGLMAAGLPAFSRRDLESN